MSTEEKKKFKKKAPWDAFLSSEAEVEFHFKQGRLRSDTFRNQTQNIRKTKY